MAWGEGGRQGIRDYDLTGLKVGQWTVLQLVGESKHYHPLWLCRCSCGLTAARSAYNLIKGRGLSCRTCQTRAASTKHGHTAKAVKTREYTSWATMLSRVRRAERGVRDKHHRHYKGITIHPTWDPRQGGSFEQFFKDMGWRPPGHSLDRIDPAGNYEPGNCKWSTQTEQNLNRRPYLFTTRDGSTRLWRGKPAN